MNNSCCVGDLKLPPQYGGERNRWKTWNLQEPKKNQLKRIETVRAELVEG
jgi:hypothetical protein